MHPYGIIADGFHLGISCTYGCRSMRDRTRWGKNGKRFSHLNRRIIRRERSRARREAVEEIRLAITAMATEDTTDIEE